MLVSRRRWDLDETHPTAAVSKAGSGPLLEPAVPYDSSLLDSSLEASLDSLDSLLSALPPLTPRAALLDVRRPELRCMRCVVDAGGLTLRRVACFCFRCSLTDAELIVAS